MALFEAVHNYYEHLVYAHIRETLLDSGKSYDERFLEDVACLALNQLPPRYVREDVDTGFFLAEGELESMELAVNNAVQAALERVRTHPEGPSTGG
ncbi:MAG: hypothetical protein Kow006_05280 [Gammaproteobacteria bacterium]